MHITQAQRYPIPLQLLIHEGRVLQNHRSIKDHNIPSGATIILNLWLRGGGAGDWGKTKIIGGTGGGSTSNRDHNTRPSFKNILQGKKPTSLQNQQAMPLGPTW